MLLAAFVLAAAPISVPSKPREVTVYPQGARVLRQGESQLPAGQVSVIFSDLPADAVESSLRLQVEGPSGTKLFGVSLDTIHTPEEVEDRIRDLQKQIQDLTDQKTDIQDRSTGRAASIEILRQLAKESADRRAAQSQEKAAALADLAQGADAVGKKIGDLLSENRKDERALRDLDAKIQALQQEVNDGGQSRKSKRSAQADLELASAGSVRFTLVYQVASASWTPLYDLRLDSTLAAPKAGLSFSGEVRQKTGEDWKGVKLTLSTARPSQGTAIPDPTNWWLDFYQAQVYNQPGRAKGRVASMAAMAPPAMAMDEGGGGGQEYEQAQVEMAQTQQAEYATSFVIKRPSDVPSDGTGHRAAIAETSHDASILLVAVPRLSQTCFIEATISYGGDQPLLPGQANLFRDDEYSGVTSLAALAPGEKLILSFGQDDRVKVERKLLDQKGADATGFSTKDSRRYRWVTTLKNFHDGKRTVEVREQLPRSKRKEITVESTELDPKPEAEDPDKPGLLRWRLGLEAQAEQKIVFAYKVKYPEGSNISGLE